MSDPGRTESDRWLSQANEDLATAHVLLDAGLVLGHSVARLCSECAVHDPAFAELRGRVKNLDHFYIDARYPNGLPEVTPAEFFDRRDADGG